MYADGSGLPLSSLRFLQNLTIQRHWRSSIDQIHRHIDCICPKLLGQSCVYSHAPGTLQKDHSHSLGLSILMRISENRLYTFDSPISTKLLEFTIVVFTLIVWLEALKLQTCLIFNLSQPHLKHIKHFWFLLQEVNSGLSTCIINKSHKI